MALPPLRRRRAGRASRRAAVLAASTVVLGAFGSPARLLASSCVSPHLTVPNAAYGPEMTDRELEGIDLGEPGHEDERVSSVYVKRGRTLVVEGRDFIDPAACSDEGEGGAGCSGPPEAASVDRLRGIVLMLEQGSQSRHLATADASQEGGVRWEVTIPATGSVGPALVVATTPAGGVTELAVRLRD